MALRLVLLPFGRVRPDLDALPGKRSPVACAAYGAAHPEATLADPVHDRRAFAVVVRAARHRIRRCEAFRAGRQQQPGKTRLARTDPPAAMRLRRLSTTIVMSIPPRDHAVAAPSVQQQALEAQLTMVKGTTGRNKTVVNGRAAGRSNDAVDEEHPKASGCSYARTADVGTIIGSNRLCCHLSQHHWSYHDPPLSRNYRPCCRRDASRCGASPGRSWRRRTRFPRRRTGRPAQSAPWLVASSAAWSAVSTACSVSISAHASHNYVVERHHPSYEYQGDFRVGHGTARKLASPITTCRKNTAPQNYRYTVVNGRTVPGRSAHPARRRNCRLEFRRIDVIERGPSAKTVPVSHSDRTFRRRYIRPRTRRTISSRMTAPIAE